MTRYDLVSPRQRKDGKTHWHKVGAAFPSDKGGFNLVFDSLPLTDAEGRCSLMMWEAKPRDDQGGGYGGGNQQRSSGQSSGDGGRSDMDDSIPF